MLGPKIDARLNLLERKLVDLTHRLERLETPAELIDLGQHPTIEQHHARLNNMLGRIEALETKRGPGRPPKGAKSGS